MAAKRKATPAKRRATTKKERSNRLLYKCETVVDEFCGYIREGLPPSACCHLTGLSYPYYTKMLRSVEPYIERGTVEEGHTLAALETWTEFFNAVNRAKAEFQLDHVRHALSVKSKREDRFMWARSMAILERRDPENWRLKKDIEVTKKDFEKDESFL